MTSRILIVLVLLFACDADSVPPPTVVAASRPAVATFDPWLLPYAFGGPWGSWLGSLITTWGRAPSPYRLWGAFAASLWRGRSLDILVRQRSLR